jgi:hypothetical protein
VGSGIKGGMVIEETISGLGMNINIDALKRGDFRGRPCRENSDRWLL